MRRSRLFAGVLCTTCTISLMWLFRTNVSSLFFLPLQSQFLESPPIILWAWERPEDLRFINPQEIGVAALMGTLSLRQESVLSIPRLQPLQVPAETQIMAVVRIESDHRHPPHLSPVQQAHAVAAIVKLINFPRIVALQVDFDATVSEREFYRALLVALRRRLPPHLNLSMTALASWCMYDDWLSGLPVDEIVPMLFRMGPDRSRLIDYIATTGHLRSPRCRRSVGISTDEPYPRLSRQQKVYLFHPQAWSQETVHTLTTEVYR